MNKTKAVNLVILSTFLIMVFSCEEKDPIANKTQDAQIVGFVTEKCYCCWGWVIEIGDVTLKAEEIPGLEIGLEETTFPLSGRITTGERTTECSDYIGEWNSLDYYEILKFTPNK